MTTTIALYRRTNMGDADTARPRYGVAADTATLVQDGGEARVATVIDGVTEEQTFSGLEREAQEWLRTTLIEYRAHEWEAVDGAYPINDRYAWQHGPCGKSSATTWASRPEARRDYVAHDAACTNYGFND